MMCVKCQMDGKLPLDEKLLYQFTVHHPHSVATQGVFSLCGESPIIREVIFLEKMMHTVKLSAQEMRKTSVVTIGGVLIAISVVLSFFKVPLGPTLQISFASLPIAAGGMLFGPFVGAVIGFVSDLLGFIVRPYGFFFPGFTLNAILIGVFYGFFFYKRKVTLLNVILSSLLVTLVINLGLTTLWLSMMYGDAFIVLLGARVLKNVLLFPIDTALLFMILKVMEDLRHRFKIS